METAADSMAPDRIRKALAELVGLPAEDVAPLESSEPGVASARVGRFQFVIAWARSGRTGPVSLALRAAQAAASSVRGATPLVAVPFMGEVGRRLCEEEDIPWLDLSGNAHIVAEGLRVVIAGQPNRFKWRGRPSSAFAPKSSRIARWLLMHPQRAASQSEIAEATGMDRGFTSRIVGRLVEDGLILRERDGNVRAADPDLLLDAWREAYDFHRHRILRGHIAARTGDGLLAKLAAELRDRDVEHSATGLAAAWMLTRFATFRTVTIYLAVEPSDALLSDLGFREEPRGANVWLVVPNDAGVFHGATGHDGVRCVHPVQVYLDLKGHPERAEEAAAQLRGAHLSWRRDA